MGLGPGTDEAKTIEGPISNGGCTRIHAEKKHQWTKMRELLAPTTRLLIRSFVYSIIRLSPIKDRIRYQPLKILTQQQNI